MTIDQKDCLTPSDVRQPLRLRFPPSAIPRTLLHGRIPPRFVHRNSPGDGLRKHREDTPFLLFLQTSGQDGQPQFQWLC